MFLVAELGVLLLIRQGHRAAALALLVLDGELGEQVQAGGTLGGLLRGNQPVDAGEGGLLRLAAEQAEDAAAQVGVLARQQRLDAEGVGLVHLALAERLERIRADPVVAVADEFEHGVARRGVPTSFAP